MYSTIVVFRVVALISNLQLPPCSKFTYYSLPVWSLVAPFGFSIGDFIAVNELVLKIFKSLSESRGSVADYKSLCKLLHSLERSLQVVSAIFLYSSSSSGSPLDIGPVINGIRHELDCCRQLMEEFWSNSRKYTETLLNGRGRKFEREWRKITWCLHKKEDVKKLQESLKGHLDALNSYASAITR